MKRHSIGTTVTISGCAFRGFTGVVVEASEHDAQVWPDYQRVRLDGAALDPQLILVTDCTPYVPVGQLGLFGGAA